MSTTPRALGVAAALTIVLLTGSLRAIENSGEGERERQFGPWTHVVNLGPIVNSDVADAGPSISTDGLSVYFHSARHSAGGETDLYVAHRAAIDLPWETPVSLGGVVNSGAPDVSPNISRDGRYLFFASARSGTFDIYFSHRADVHSDAAWEPPIALADPVNGPSFDAGPCYFELPGARPQLYFASDRANGLGQAGLDIYVTELGHDGTWTAPAFVVELNSAFQDNRPAIRFDGLEMVFTSSRSGDLDLYTSRRRYLWEAWSEPVRIDLPVNTASAETQAAFSANGRTLYFTSNRPGGSGNFDLFAAARPAERRHD